MTEAHERRIVLSEDEQREIFGADWDPQCSQRARLAWGGSTQWVQFAGRFASR